MSLDNKHLAFKGIILLKVNFIGLISSDGSNNVPKSMFNRSKTKIGCSSLITIKWTQSNSFDVWKKDVWVSSMSNLVNLVKALLGLKFDVRSFKARKKGVRVRSQIDEHVRVRSIFDKMVFDPSLLISTTFEFSHLNDMHFSLKIGLSAGQIWLKLNFCKFENVKNSSFYI